MAITAHFDLEVKQHNIINAFIYASRQSEGPPVTCYMPDGFPMPGILVEVK
jgi:sRNA-binding regulator protein Hfq